MIAGGVLSAAIQVPPTKIVAPYLAPYLEERDTKTGTRS